jgi:hypothetical protein
MSKTGADKTIQLLWIVGSCFWCLMILLLWWRVFEARNFAQASLSTGWLGMVSATTVLWCVGGAAFLRHKKKRTN